MFRTEKCLQPKFFFLGIIYPSSHPSMVQLTNGWSRKSILAWKLMLTHDVKIHLFWLKCSYRATFKRLLMKCIDLWRNKLRERSETLDFTNRDSLRFKQLNSLIMMSFSYQQKKTEKCNVYSLMHHISDSSLPWPWAPQIHRCAIQKNDVMTQIGFRWSLQI